MKHIQLDLSRDELHTILRLVDFRISHLRGNGRTHAEQRELSETVEITRLRMVVQSYLNNLNQGGC